MEKNNNKVNLFANEYVELLRNVVDQIIFFGEVDKARELSQFLEKEVSANLNELKAQPDLQNFYRKTILKLKFICLATLGDKEILNMIKNDFCLQFEMADYDLLARLKSKLLSIIVIEERNKFKEALKQALTENTEKITGKHEIRFIKDWIKNYISHVGLEKKDSLKRAQYLTDLKNNKDISPAEYQKLIGLFDFYDEMNIPSDSPEGFESEPLIMIDGKLYIFKKGVLEPVGESKELKEAMNLLGEDLEENRPASQPQSVPQPRLAPQPQSASQSQTVTQSQPSPRPLFKIPDLEQALKNYSPSSLEYKVIKEEINRLKKEELKKAH